MSPQQSRTLTRRLLLFVVFCAASIFLSKTLDNLQPSMAQEDNSQETKETVLENEIPRHVPLKVKIRKEKETAFKNLKNERWARDFELEVTNTGDKPIYTLSLMLVTDVKAAAGFRIVAPLFYGKLGKVTDKAEPEAIPIKPGETYIFKIHPGQLNAWDTIQRTEHRPHPKKIEVMFEALSFGDGTGFIGEDGEAIPHALVIRTLCVTVMDRS